MLQLLMSILLTLADLTSTTAEPVWQPAGGGIGITAQTHVTGEVETLPEAGGGLTVRGWVVDGYSATRPDLLQVQDLSGTLLGEVASGGFVRRSDVENRFGSSAFSLSGFELSIAEPPSTLLVRAHLGRMGWWQAMVDTSVSRTASIVRLECVSSEAVEVEVRSAEPFPVRNALTLLDMGTVESYASRYPDDGDTHGLIFTISRDELNNLSSDDQAFVRYDPSNGNDVWQIGSIDAGTAHNCNDPQVH